MEASFSHSGPIGVTVSAVLYRHGEHPSHQRLRAGTVPGGVGGVQRGSVEVPL